MARVQKMLDSCAEILDEVGYDGLTTTMVAERAGVAIGSFYQFFPDKRAVVQSLGQRNVEAYVCRLEDRISRSGISKWTEAVDASIDEYIDMHRTVAGFRTLHFGDAVDVHLLDEQRDNDTIIAEQLGRLLSAHFGITEDDSLRFVLLMAVEIADALVKSAFRYRPDGDERILAEAKRIVRDYLTARLG
jgi:AcrR family transcriptional regulator